MGRCGPSWAGDGSPERARKGCPERLGLRPGASVVCTSEHSGSRTHTRVRPSPAEAGTPHDASGRPGCPGRVTSPGPWAVPARPHGASTCDRRRAELPGDDRSRPVCGPSGSVPPPARGARPALCPAASLKHPGQHAARPGPAPAGGRGPRTAQGRAVGCPRPWGEGREPRSPSCGHGTPRGRLSGQCRARGLLCFPWGAGFCWGDGMDGQPMAGESRNPAPRPGCPFLRCPGQRWQGVSPPRALPARPPLARLWSKLWLGEARELSLRKKKKDVENKERKAEDEAAEDRPPGPRPRLGAPLAVPAPRRPGRAPRARSPQGQTGIAYTGFGLPSLHTRHRAVVPAGRQNGEQREGRHPGRRGRRGKPVLWQEGEGVWGEGERVPLGGGGTPGARAWRPTRSWGGQRVSTREDPPARREPGDCGLFSA